MYTLGELKKQNQEICHLADVLDILIKDQHIIKNPFVCDLVSRFNEKVWMHLVFEDNSLYAELAKHRNPDISQLADDFHATTRAIRKDFSDYIKLWCKASGASHHQQAFCEQTPEILNKVRQRVKFETENMFPLVEAETAKQ